MFVFAKKAYRKFTQIYICYYCFNSQELSEYVLTITTLTDYLNKLHGPFQDNVVSGWVHTRQVFAYSVKLK